MNQKKNRWKWTALILMIVMIGCLFPAFAFADAGTPGDVEQFAAVILHTNDAHVAFEDNIGYDGLALYKKELKAVYDHVLLIDAGDAIQGAPIGSVSKGAEIIRMMNRLGYDLAVPGNHEFDYGLEALDDCAEALDCGYTCANFCVTGGEPVFQPWRILEAGDLKIGFVGAVTPDAYTKSTIKDILNEAGEPMYDFLADETGQRLCVGLQKAIDETRQAGADYVILVSHLGNNDSITEQFRTDAVVGKLRGLDLIIDGHSHETYNRTVTDGENRQVPIAQTGSNMKAIGQIKIYKDGRLEETLIDTVPEPANMPFEKVVRRNVERCVDPEMKAFLDEIVASYAPVMNRKVGEVSYDMIVRDADGFDVSRLTSDGRMTVFPRWQADGESIIYISDKGGAPQIWQMNTKTGARSVKFSFKGTPAGVAVSPDGSKIAAILSFQGNPELYVLQGGNYTRLTNTPLASEGQPTWSPDGSQIAYVSDETRHPQIYVVDVATRQKRRLTSRGSMNFDPDWGADGRIAYITRRGAAQVAVMSPNSGDASAQLVTEQSNWEHPSWSRDGRHLVANRDRALFLIDTLEDGDKPRQLFIANGNWISPSWQK